MNTENLATYLNDHYAGSVSAVELLAHLIKTLPGTNLEKSLAHILDDVLEDQETLRKLMERLGIAQNKFKSATAWVSEKMARFKLHPSGDPNAALLLSLEALVLGIQGKRGLWKALAAAGRDEPAFAGIDFRKLEARAIEQSTTMETHRLDIAGIVLKG